MAHFEALLGETLTNKEGHTVYSAELAEAEAVGLYFSAHWCPPCREFTPKLAEWYPKLKKDKKFQIVFISSDRSPADFDTYMQEMPWLALPYAERNLKAKLAGKFKVQGIPTLVILDAKTGKLITKDGRDAIVEDPDGNSFPWRAPSVKDILKDANLIDNAGNKHTAEELKDKVLGLYFSAHWCPPCQRFTPVFAATFKKLKEQNKNFEVVYVSADRDESSFKQYFGTMPWWALEFSDKERAGKLNQAFGVQGIPMLIIYDVNTGKVITTEARGAISEDTEGKDFPWPEKLVKVISGSTAGSLNECTAVIAFAGTNNHDNVDAAFTKVASESKSEDDFKFFVATTHPIVERVKELLKVNDSNKLAILDIPSESYVVLSEISDLDHITAESVSKALKDYTSGRLERRKLGE